MDIEFVGERWIYLDDMNVFPKTNDEHLSYLKKKFIKCRKYSLSLNSKKSHFSFKEGKFPGHIVSKDGVRRDIERMVAIQLIDLHRNKKEVQYFM